MAAGQIVQDLAGVGSAGHFLTPLGGHRGQHRKLDHELDDVGRKVGQHLALEVLGDGVGLTAEAGRGLGELSPVDQRQAGQSQTGGPALGASHHQRHRVGRNRPIHWRETGRLVVGESQLILVDLDQAAAQAQQVQREKRRLPAGNDQMNMGRQMACQIR